MSIVGEGPLSEGEGPVGAPGRRDVGVIIPAAGSGVRFGQRKAFLELSGRPLLFHVLRAFTAVEDVREIAIAVAADEVGKTREGIREWAGGMAPSAGAAAGRGREAPRISVVAGGRRRQDSVLEGLWALSGDIGPVLVHDAARPLIHPEDIRNIIAAIRHCGAAVLGFPATDSVKEEREGFVARELERSHVWLVQTPQGARAEILRKAFEDGLRSGLEVTDEVGLLHAQGIPVRLVEGRRTNLKITFPEDLPLAAFMLEKISASRS